ncbi:MAG TPA: SRPBCC family protein [Vicinamibacterales bacterium]|jgi:ribosome-associated toxin RatA of RatAB toxin-antitoxin module|nr:SRPBCC family protein [Vicinamibacterales bacterium]
MLRKAPAIVALVVLGGLTATQAAGDEPLIHVRKDEDGYVVMAQFEVAARPEVVLRVLGDYEQIPHLLPRVTRSVVTARDGSHVVVEQTVAARVLMFSKELHLVLDVREDTDTIAFHDTCHQSFKNYTGWWAVRPSATGSTVVYELSATPAFDVPSMVLARLLRRDSTEMIEALRRAMLQGR